VAINLDELTDEELNKISAIEVMGWSVCPEFGMYISGGEGGKTNLKEGRNEHMWPCDWNPTKSHDSAHKLVDNFSGIDLIRVYSNLHSIMWEYLDHNIGREVEVRILQATPRQKTMATIMAASRKK